MQDGEFESLSQPSRISFTLAKLQPPSDLYITRDDQIVVRAIGTVASESIHVTGRLLTLDGVVVPFAVDVVAPIASTSVTRLISGVEGFLLSLTAIATQATTRGGAYVRVWLNRGAAALTNCQQLLLSDYVTNVLPTSWPSGIPQDTTSGFGLMLSLAGTSPAAGADFTGANGSLVRWRLQSLSAILTTSVAVANRNIEFALTDAGGLTVFRAGATASVPASTTAHVTCTPGGTQVSVVGSTLMIPLPALVMMPLNYGFKTITTNLQAADQWSAIQMVVEQWFDGL